jgi:hypothetical protein
MSAGPKYYRKYFRHSKEKAQNEQLCIMSRERRCCLRRNFK